MLDSESDHYHRDTEGVTQCPIFHPPPSNRV
jgi:hypothetical protein